MSYGVLIHAVPIIVANVIVAGLAIFSSFRTAQGAEPASAAREPLATDEGSSFSRLTIQRRESHQG